MLLNFTDGEKIVLRSNYSFEIEALVNLSDEAMLSFGMISTDEYNSRFEQKQVAEARRLKECNLDALRNMIEMYPKDAARLVAENPDCKETA